MKDYLYSFTERALKGSRSGELEKQQIASELMKLIEEKPEDASPDMVNYLEFLLALTTGQDYDVIWQKLSKELQDVFGMAMKKFKGDDISIFFEELTDRVIDSIKNNDNTGNTGKEAIKAEVDKLISESPEKGSKEVLAYLAFLKKLLNDESPENEYNVLDSKLKAIYDDRIKNTVQNDMLDFMDKITALAFKAHSNEDIRPQAEDQLSSMLRGENQPPQDIANYISTLIEVSRGNMTDEMTNQMPAELHGIFLKHKQ